MNPPVNGGFSSQRPVTRSFDVFLDLRLNKWLNKWSRRRCLRRHRAHCDVTVMQQSLLCALAMTRPVREFGRCLWRLDGAAQRSRNVTLRFLCARNIVLQYKINFCLISSALCVFHVFWLCLTYIYKYWVRVRLRSVYVIVQHMVNSKWFQISTKISWAHAVTDLQGLS